MAVSYLRDLVGQNFCLHQGYMIVKEEAEGGEGQRCGTLSQSDSPPFRNMAGKSGAGGFHEYCSET